MDDAPLIAHSLAEVYLFLMATPCPSCGKGPLHGGDPLAAEDTTAKSQTPSPSQGEGGGEGQGLAALRITADCGACHAMSHWVFQLPTATPTPVDQPPVINPTSSPSEILDVAQWLTLFGMITAAAERQPDKQAARRLRLEAGQCLEEALKFYEPGNDLPPPAAFFHEGSRQRLRTHPEQFSRQRLLALRSKLPTEYPMRPMG